MLARVYDDTKNNRKVALVPFGKLYELDEYGNAVPVEYSIIKFMLETYIGHFTLGKKGMGRTYDFVKIDTVNYKYTK